MAERKHRADNRLREIRMREFMMNKKSFAEFLEVEYSLYHRYEIGEVYPEVPRAIYISEKLKRNVNDIWYLI